VGAPVDGRVMTLVALGGMLANGVQLAVLGHSHASHGGVDDLEIAHEDDAASGGAAAPPPVSLRAAYIHVVGGLVQSTGVLLAGGVIWARPDLQMIDPAVTLLFCLLVLGTTFSVLSQCVEALMECAPNHVDRDALVDGLLALSGVLDVHDLHLWSLRQGEAVLATHLLADGGLDGGELRALLDAARLTCARLGIKHVTIQLEPACPGAVELYETPSPTDGRGRGPICTQFDDY